MSTLLIASHNRGKLAELAELLSPLGVTCRIAPDLHLPSPPETETTFAGNARLKARAGYKATGLATLADDSGCTVEDLAGAPGVLTADWCTTAGSTTDFGSGMVRIHQALLASGRPPPWKAQLVCVLVLIQPDGSEHFFEGAISGEVIWPPRGERGRALEPIFVPEGSGGRTMAEMPPEEKLATSHRGRAFEALRCFLAAHPEALASSD
nr:non-canonical purine NTP pyrophosphatase [Paracoccus saliphilus]